MVHEELDEFLELAVADVGDDSGSIRERVRPTGAVPSDGVKEKERGMVGGVTQYASVGGGYIPTSDTIKTLPADCYTLTMTMEGNIVMVPQKLVTDDLMRLPDSKSDEVVNEVEKFWTLKDRFKKFGFAHKRGFLLWGPPGSGKTSTVSIIINDMVKSGGIVILAEHPGILAKALVKFRTIETNRPLVVIWEDIDTIIMNYGESQVLSILDGESQVENVVFIATTNYPERLDGRVINRPSRFDKIVKIGMPNSAAREMYLKSKIDDVVKDGINLVNATDGLSIAHIKELIISAFCQETPVKEVLERLKRMKHAPTSDGEKGPLGLG